MSKKLRLLFSLASLMIIMCFSASLVMGDEVANEEVAAQEADGDQVSGEDMFGDYYQEEQTTNVDDTIMYSKGRVSLSQLKQVSDSIINQIPQLSALSEEELDYLVEYYGNQTDFYENYKTAVVDGNYGEYVSADVMKVVELKEEGKENDLQLVTRMHFKNVDADFIVDVTVYDNLGPITKSAHFKAIEDESLATKMKSAGANTLMGMGTVFVVLIVMMLIISCFSIIPKIQNAFAKGNNEGDSKVATDGDSTTETSGNLADDGELVAVIAAAIAASENTTTDGFVVRSIRRR